MPEVSSRRIFAGVELGEGVELGDYVVIGQPAKGQREGDVKTIIGAGSVIRSHTVIYAGARLGEECQTGHGALIREHTTLGNEVSIGSHAVIEHHVTVGDGVRIHSQAFVPEFSVLENHCWVGPNAVLTNARYPLSDGVKEELIGPTLREGAIVGANATLLPGIAIGKRALVGAGAVVTEDVPDGAVVVGNPARIIKTTDDLPYELA
ncbi:MAG: transferase [Acidobacteria bacterium]|nr:transferase [Acidobacteriota bacterium]